jgi:hypothetical protein
MSAGIESSLGQVVNSEVICSSVKCMNDNYFNFFFGFSRIFIILFILSFGFYEFLNHLNKNNKEVK